MTIWHRCSRRGATALMILIIATSASLGVFGRGIAPAGADSYVPVSGAGSSWSANALNQWIADVNQYGMKVNYAPTGSSDGRSQFLSGTVDFAASDIPFQSKPEDGSAPEQPASGSYAYMPITAGGTVFMYNLTINGQRVTNLRLSGQNIVKIFTGVITKWNDPALIADNPGLALPDRAVVPVVRSDGSGSTAQFSLWMIKQYPDLWNAYCQKSGRAPACGETSFYPTIDSMVAQSGDLGVAGYVAQNYSVGAIGYVEYSYALNAHFPVAKMLNAAGYYTEPTPQDVAVSLLKAQVDTTDTDPSLYLTQQLGGVYGDTDPRTYELSSYSYMILPAAIQGQFSAAKGKTLAAFLYYAMCQGQQESASLGYSPMPVNLVQASFDQIKKIPGAVVQNINIQTCNNPTFSPGSPNLLADTAPMPAACDKQGPTQCATGTGGATQSTPASGGSTSSGSTSGSSTSGSSTSGSSTSGGSTSGGSTGGTKTTASKTRQSTTGAKGAAAVGSTAGNSATATGAGSSSATTIATGSAGACDPSAGSCATGAVTGSDASSGAAAGASTALASANPTTLPTGKGWTTTQTLVLLVVLLTVGLVFAPGLAARYLQARDE